MRKSNPHADPFGDESLSLTLDQFEAFQRGEVVTQWGTIEPDPEFPDYELGTPREEILQDKREQLERLERGDVPVTEPPHDPQDPKWQDYCRRSREWREALIRGEDAGPRPEPPARPSIREHPSFQRELQREATKVRAELRRVGALVALDRCNTRRRSVKLQSTHRRTHGTRRRPGVRVVRRRANSSRGSPSDSPGDEPPGEAEPPTAGVRQAASALSARNGGWR